MAETDYPNLNPSGTTNSNGSVNDMKSSLSSGPVAESVKNEASKTSSEFQNLANARTQPDQPAATGQPLTHYHSMFYNLLSWENPRATALMFAGSVVFIFMSRYLNILRYMLKVTYFVLGATASAELVGGLLFNNGFSSRLRPKQYYVIPREVLERNLEDVEQLINFFVIESQRILFAENVYATLAAFAAAVVSYWLIKFVPLWGLSLVGTCVIYLTPLIYIKNRETIDGQIQNVGSIVNSQATQIKDLTAQHATRATESVKSYAGEYTSKAQEYIGSARNTSAPASTSIKTEEPIAAPSAVSSSDLPSAPSSEPLPSEINVEPHASADVKEPIPQ